MSDLYIEQHRQLRKQFSEMTELFAAKLMGRDLTLAEMDYLRGAGDDESS